MKINAILAGIAMSLLLLTISAAASDYTLGVFGNANEDDIINMQDVTYTELIILEYKEETQLADARYDGEIDILDVTQIELIILGREKELTLLDMDDRVVTIDKPVERVITSGYGFSPCVMAAFGVEDKLVGTGGGMTPLRDETTATFLVPELKNLPDLGRGYTLNIEAAVALNPDIIILVKDGAGQGSSLPKYNELIEKLDKFDEDFQVIVLNNPACYQPPDVRSIYREIEILGAVFGKQEKAQEIIDYLDEEVEFVKERTEDIPDEGRPLVSYFGMLGGLGKSAVGLMLPDYDCGTLFPDITKIRNAYTGDTRALMSSEQILVSNPDVIIMVSTPAGVKVNQLYEEEYYKEIQEVEAIKERRVYSIGWLELHRTLAGLEFPIELMIEAKGVYPDRFEDADVGELLTKHYKELYGLSDDEVEELKAIMELDWMDEQGF